MAKNEEQINKLREHIRKTKAENYPIEGHLLEKEPDYNKNFYFKMLCMILQYSDSIAEEQTMFLQRLIKGCHAENSLQDYMRQALELDVEDYKEFVEKVLQGDLKYMFVLDVLLVSHLGECKNEYCKFLAEVIESMEININELNFISKICNSILEQNSKNFEVTIEEIKTEISNLIFLPYLDMYFSGLLLKSQENMYYYSNDKINQRVLKNFSTEIKSNKVTYENLKIKLTDENLNFIGCKEVKFINCDFLSNGGRLYFSNVGKVEFENCKFTKFEDILLLADSLNSLYMVNCKIFECGYEVSKNDDADADDYAQGGVICLRDETDNISIENCIFTNCFIEANDIDCCATGAILYASSDKIVLRNNEFIGCIVKNNLQLEEVLISGEYESMIDENNVCSGGLRILYYLDECET